MPLWMTTTSPVQSTMGMGISVIGLAMGCPAGVSYSHRSFGKNVLQAGGEAVELAGRLDDLGVALFVEDGDARAIVTAVLEAP